MPLILLFVFTDCSIIFLIATIWIHILSYDEIANLVERAYLSSLLMGNGDTETGLKKLKETLKDLANPKKINSRIN